MKTPTNWAEFKSQLFTLIQQAQGRDLIPLIEKLIEAWKAELNKKELDDSFIKKYL